MYGPWVFLLTIGVVIGSSFFTNFHDQDRVARQSFVFLGLMAATLVIQVMSYARRDDLGLPFMQWSLWWITSLFAVPAGLAGLWVVIKTVYELCTVGYSLP
jgi:hypothetical protein